MLTVLKILYILVVVLLVTVILLQEPRSSGFSAALGGMEQIIGVRGIPSLMAKVTGVLFALFLILSLAISIVIGRQMYKPKTAIGKEIMKGKPPVSMPVQPQQPIKEGQEQKVPQPFEKK